LSERLKAFSPGGVNMEQADAAGLS